MVRSSFEIAAPHDDHDEYWDDEDNDDHEGDESEGALDEDDVEEYHDGLANGNGHHAVPTEEGGRPPSQQSKRPHRHGGRRQQHRKKKAAAAAAKMKRMKVATQRDYGVTQSLVDYAMSPRARGICCLGSIVVLILILAIRLIIPKQSSGSFGVNQEITCTIHTTQEPFSEWMHHIRRSNESELCRSEVPVEDCDCHNPFLPSYDEDKEGWHDVFDANLQNLNKTLEQGVQYDLVLYGDSIVERMTGKVFGQESPEMQEQAEVTHELFTKGGGGQINACPLGIAGDEIHTLMYRLKNGEMPENLKPGAWWLMIGTNDVLKSNCDVDAVVAGVITLAEEILRRDEINRQYDASHVVINSLFPRVELDADPLWSTIQDINSRLECYAESTEGIEFFNATELFVSQHSDGTYAIDPAWFMSDQIHLSADGMRVWEQAIVEKALYLIAHNS